MVDKKKVKKVINAVVNAGSEALDKVSSPASRAGNTIERVGKMAKSGVSSEAITAQLKHGSATNYNYTVTQVEGMVALYDDCHKKVPVTKAAAGALIDDAKANGCPDGNELPA
ncbi:hypothetical protein F9U39_11990 [Pectobacterium versatile]|uniref:hypothetical protein n=1 Tax=Pectobacterium versatile TaxID=2488639 RepID=UPI001B36A73A|nr:hypothetical protein [Pectobacterium versatile]MBQ4790145.1 hypothetical protein [Pectobacterium versatile]GKX39951.1 hypothetical protein SOASR014_36900 [Pectobacterium carotovorum subsp. carotovorum]GLX46155.1 hypothetical protein Pcaca01_38230 [Pectobacterium carotovorum subsp. carotovorum]